MKLDLTLFNIFKIKDSRNRVVLHRGLPSYFQFQSPMLEEIVMILTKSLK